MKVLVAPFNMYQWRVRMGFTQAAAAKALGISLAQYRKIEYASLDDQRMPVRLTYIYLAKMIEEHGAPKLVRPRAA